MKITYDILWVEDEPEKIQALKNSAEAYLNDKRPVYLLDGRFTTRKVLKEKLSEADDYVLGFCNCFYPIVGDSRFVDKFSRG